MKFREACYYFLQKFWNWLKVRLVAVYISTSCSIPVGDCPKWLVSIYQIVSLSSTYWYCLGSSQFRLPLYSLGQTFALWPRILVSSHFVVRPISARLRRTLTSTRTEWNYLIPTVYGVSTSLKTSKEECNMALVTWTYLNRRHGQQAGIHHTIDWSHRSVKTAFVVFGCSLNY